MIKTTKRFYQSIIKEGGISTLDQKNPMQYINLTDAWPKRVQLSPLQQPINPKSITKKNHTKSGVLHTFECLGIWIWDGSTTGTKLTSFGKHPQLNPQGTHILFEDTSKIYNNRENHIFCIDLASHELSYIGKGTYPKWTPDGDVIVSCVNQSPDILCLHYTSPKGLSLKDKHSQYQATFDTDKQEICFENKKRLMPTG